MGRLDISDPAIADAVNDVKEHNTATNFAVFKYVPKTDKLKVQDVEEPTGDIMDMMDELNDGQVQYVFMRFKVSEGFKFIYVAWCGEGVSGMLRGNFANHATDMENFLTKNRLGFHVRINARSESDLEEEDIIKKINSAKGANFVKAGTRAQGTGPDLKQVSGQFWNQQQEKDKAHAAAMSQHQQNKLAEMERSKEMEAQRMKQEADQLLQQKEQERQAEHNQHMQGEQQRQQQWEQHQNQQRDKILKQQEDMRAAAPKAAISHASKDRAEAPEHNKYVAPEPAPSQATPPSWEGDANPSGGGPPVAARGPPVAARGPPGGGGGPPPPSGPKPGGGAPPPAAAPPVAAAPEPEPAAPAADAGGYDAGGYDEGGYDEGGYDEGGYDEGGYDEGGYDEGAAAAAPPAGGLGTATAMYDYAGEGADDLSFAENDVITILDNSDTEGWWQGELNGVTGWFPSNFVQAN